MNIKFKNLFKACLISALVLISCDENDLDDSGLELGVKPFNLANRSGGASFSFEIDDNEDFVTDLVVTNKIPQSNTNSVFIISETTEVSENVVRDRIIRVFSNIENVRAFNFDVGRKTQFKIWSLRYLGNVQGLPAEIDANVSGEFFVDAITGSDVGLTDFADAIIVNVVEPIPDSVPVPDPMNVQIVNFDDIAGSFFSFNDSVYELVDNPFVEGANNVDSKVGKLENTGVQEFEGFGSDVSVPIDFGASSSKTLVVKIYSTTSVPVDFQVGNGVDDARAAAKTVTHGGTGWEELEFDYNTGAIKTFDGSADQGESFIPEGVFESVTVLIDGAGTATGVYYIDDIELKVN